MKKTGFKLKSLLRWKSLEKNWVRGSHYYTTKHITSINNSHWPLFEVCTQALMRPISHVASSPEIVAPMLEQDI